MLIGETVNREMTHVHGTWRSSRTRFEPNGTSIGGPWSSRSRSEWWIVKPAPSVGEMPDWPCVLKYCSDKQFRKSIRRQLRGFFRPVYDQRTI